MSSRASRAGIDGGAALVLGVLTFGYRFLSLTGMPNDHYLHLAGALQVLRGDWPSWDFEDPGMPLMYVVSAAARLLAGHALVGEVMLFCAAFALAAVLTWMAALWLSGSRVAALAAVLAEVLIVPRSYSYPKVLLYACSAVGMLWYAQRPGRARALALAMLTGTAFLFRYDHGLFLGIGHLVVIHMAAPAPFARVAWRRSATFVAAVALILAPYLVYLQAGIGLPQQVRTAVRFSAAEARQTELETPSFAFGSAVEVPPTATPMSRVSAVAARNAVPWLFYLLHLVPWIALAVVAWRGGDGSSERRRPVVMGLAVVAIVVAWSFLRDPLEARLPDAIVPGALLAAWLAATAWRAPTAWPPARLFGRVVVAGLTIVTYLTITALGATAEQVNRMALGYGGRISARAAERLAELREPFNLRQMPSAVVGELRPALEFIDRCSRPTDRLLVTAFFPELYIYGDRPFAAGLPTFFTGYYEGDEEQQRMQARLRRQWIPYALIVVDERAGLERGFPGVAAFLDGFRPLAEFSTRAGPIQLAYNPGRGSGALDAATGWVCFR